jgi:hypothetical protein
MAIAGIPGREKLRMGLRNSLPRLYACLNGNLKRRKKMKYRRLGRNGPMVMKRTTFQRRERLLDGKLAGYLRPRFLLAIILLVITMSTVSEADCWDDSLNQVNRDILVMDSGAVYQVVPSDVINSVFWLPLTNATVCDSLVDVGGELMTYYRIFNRDTGVSVWAERER